MEKAVFEYQDYKHYLRHRMDNELHRGGRSRMAKAIGCQTAFVSSVLRGKPHFTPDQGEAINEFLGHSDLEAEYFFLILLHQRATYAGFKRRLERKIEETKNKRHNLKARLSVPEELSFEQQAIYYSEWYFAALHMLLSVPALQDLERLSAILGLSRQSAKQAVRFLEETGLLETTKSGWRLGKARIHLGDDSPFISRHHANWRMQAIRDVERRQEGDLHYSSAVSLSRETANEIRDQMVAFIKRVKALVKESREETVYCFNLDFFSLVKEA